jgi:hypothetical protein
MAEAIIEGTDAAIPEDLRSSRLLRLQTELTDAAESHLQRTTHD